MRLVRLICVIYWGCLTVLLLVPSPRALLFGVRPLSALAVNRGVHFAFFAILAFLACASQWSIHRRALAVVLVAYAVLTETAQWMVPRRKVELLDLAENLTGLLVGVAVWAALRSTSKLGP